MDAAEKPVISDDYRRLQQKLHENPAYGVASLGFVPVVAKLLTQIGATSLADYGAGKQNLRKGLEEAGVQLADYRPYDPAFPEYGPARTGDLLCCIDVLEHIEPEFLDNVLDELQRLTRRVGFFSVHTGPATKTLADGRNAHLIQQPSSWWLPRLCQRFEVDHLQRTQGGFFVVVRPREGA